jgi:hypothetical protein
LDDGNLGYDHLINTSAIGQHLLACTQFQMESSLLIESVENMKLEITALYGMSFNISVSPKKKRLKKDTTNI